MRSRTQTLFHLAVAFCAVSSAAHAASAVRALPDSVLPGASFTVTITLDPPPGASVVAVEDAPPSGWAVSTISNSGTFDMQTGKVKWGLFFAPSIPAALTYDVTATAQASSCFAGLASYDGVDTPITGDLCTITIPTISTWGGVALVLSLLIAGTALQRRAAV